MTTRLFSLEDLAERVLLEFDRVVPDDRPGFSDDRVNSLELEQRKLMARDKAADWWAQDGIPSFEQLQGVWRASMVYRIAKEQGAAAAFWKLQHGGAR